MKSHSLFRLASRVYNTPHLITPAAFNVILDYLDQRNAGRMDMPMDDPTSTPDNDGDEPIVGDVGVLYVDGSLTYKPVMTLCGEAGTSYQSLVEQVEEMAEAGIKTMVMMVSSGGGEASHVFESANDIRAILDANNIYSIGYADTVAASAAYALISICDEVIANPSADVGSIGCVVALLDTSKAYEQAGLKRIFITSGENKVPFAEDGSFKEEFLAEIQTSVDKLNAEFAAHVSKYTGLSVDTIMGFEAKCFDADEALSNGLINQIMTTKQFAAYVADKHKGL
jgi:ClpP class serine protease